MFEEGSTSRNVGYFIPGVGTYLSVQDAVKDPSWANIGAAGLNALGDITSVFGFGNAIRTASAASKAASRASKALTTLSRVLKNASNADKVFRSSVNTANRLSSRASFAPLKLIPRFLKEANVANANMRQALSSYNAALNALDGSSVRQAMNTYHLPGGGVMKKKAVIFSNPRLGYGAVGNAQRASAQSLNAAQKAKQMRPFFFSPVATGAASGMANNIKRK